ncbi:nucleotidyltransferase domain-containing protein [Solirubrum puertoriconensis]|uniref:Nucleotidyltransferase n=1 Tax=Solirubrum puertoriconensis TaxID=1751427 RepID=A0A9X0L5J2_SOLP1|nr:nucleotidyltransferase domain-containing protein [Solirubrum puertoriconensis]KUG08794.1 hypothetical protein ASU33_11730 [Solirubrum puertoriconensis]
MHNRIQAELSRLEQNQHIRILYACESGSRGWGFASSDSDYDVRFIYCHPAYWYLRLDEERDSLNLPISDELDLSGWELRKALKLLRGSNAALLEWLQSPVIYQEAHDFRTRIEALLPACYNPAAALHHYLGLVRRGVEDDLVGEQVRLKRLFYALRSALALRWVRQQPGQVPPMAFGQLRALLPPELAPEVDELLLRKAAANEKTTAPTPKSLAYFIEGEYEVAQAVRTTLRPEHRSDATSPLNELFQHLIRSAF